MPKYGVYTDTSFVGFYDTEEEARDVAIEYDRPGEVMYGPMIDIEISNLLDMESDVIEAMCNAMSEFYDDFDVWIPDQLIHEAETALKEWTRKYVRINPTERCDVIASYIGTSGE